MSKKVLITGATGFVGRQVLRHITREDVRLTVVLRDGKQAALIDHPAIEAVITSPDLFEETAAWWTNALEGIDTVIHVAWHVESGSYLQSSKNFDCLQGTLNMAKGTVQAGVRRFIGIGTCFEYDLSHGPISIETALRPLTPYAATKAAAFLALSQFLPSQEVEFSWCRLFYLFGEGEDERRLVPYLRLKLATGQPAELSSGKQILDFMDVSEAGRMIANCALSRHLGPANICSGEPITVRQLAEGIADEYGRRDLLKFRARPEKSFDPQLVVGKKTLFDNC